MRNRLRHASETHGSTTGSEGSLKENSRPNAAASAAAAAAAALEQQNNNLGMMLPKSLDQLNGGRHRHQSQFHGAVPLLPNTAKLYRWECSLKCIVPSKRLRETRAGVIHTTSQKEKRKTEY